MTRLLSQKIRVNFLNSTAQMSLLRHQQALLVISKSADQMKLIYQNLSEMHRLKLAVHAIESFFFRRKVRRIRLLKRCRPASMVQIQKLARGFLARRLHAATIRKFKRAALLKSKGYLMATKIQALVRGWLFRNKRWKAL